MSQPFAIELFKRGYTDLVSVIPVNAKLSGGSKIAPNQLGKAPGRKLSNGAWAGYGWRTHAATEDDVRTWELQGASVGLRARNFPSVDIDSLDPWIVEVATEVALRVFGPAPRRVGRAPKVLLMYRLHPSEEPITRVRFFITDPTGTVHLIEILGDGQQFLVKGIHSGTLRPYEWLDAVPDAAELTPITHALIDQFGAELKRAFGEHGYTVTMEGSSRKRERAVGDQHELLAPSIDELRAVVELIPNSNDAGFGTREAYIKVGYAIRAACGAEEDAGYEMFSEWAARWEDGANDPDTVAADWRRMQGPFSVGWRYLTGLAGPYGYNDAALDFDPIPPINAVQNGGSNSLNMPLTADELTETVLADVIIERRGEVLRYVPATGRWLVWDGTRWEHDELLRAQNVVVDELARVAREREAAATTDKERRAAQVDRKRIESHRMTQAVMATLKGRPVIALDPASLDADPMLLNTPSGVVNLHTGALLPHRPEYLLTKATQSGPDYEGGAPEWRRFLAEATGGDLEEERYLQKLAGYCLTGLTKEQAIYFLYGPSMTGKSTFINALLGVLGTYAATAAMSTFTESKFDSHPADLAALMGARMVTASETQAGRRWDEARIKLLSGGDTVTARFMRQDFFTYRPQFKLLFMGNHQPSVRDLDSAVKRRMNLIPFTVTPAQRDDELPEKLASEYPAILAWMIEGCLLWQREGLDRPQRVEDMTEQYFEDEDAVGRWIHERCLEAPNASALSTDLYESWREWAASVGEYVGSQKRLTQALRSRGFELVHHTKTRRAQFRGLAINPATIFPGGGE